MDMVNGLIQRLHAQATKRGIAITAFVYCIDASENLVEEREDRHPLEARRFIEACRLRVLHGDEQFDLDHARDLPGPQRRRPARVGRSRGGALGHRGSRGGTE